MFGVPGVVVVVPLPWTYKKKKTKSSGFTYITFGYGEKRKALTGLVLREKADGEVKARVRTGGREKPERGGIHIKVH